jgi:hypothetical protein
VKTNTISSWFAEARTILFATFVTGLIWIWAEGESVTSIAVPVRVLLPDGRTTDLELNAPDFQDHSTNVMLRLEGSRLSVDAAAALRGVTLTIDPGAPGVPTQAGTNLVVDLRRALSVAPEITSLNLPLLSVDPESLVVNAVRLATRELPVRVELAREVSLASDPVPSVARIRVRVPEPLASKLPDDAQVVAFISDDQLLNLRGEGSQSVKATCRLPASLAEVTPVRFQPETISVTLRVRQSLESAKLPATVPVWYSLPPTEDSKSWDIEVLDKFLADITVSGPAEQIARVAKPGTSAGLAPIKALVELTSDDLAKAAASAAEGAESTPKPPESLNILTKPVIFTGLPSSVSVVGTPAVRVRITRVASPAGAATPAPKPMGSDHGP